MIGAGLEKITPEGELGFRLAKNFARLQEAEYRPEVVFSIEKNGWAGDWEGRTILALTLLSRATGQKAAYLDDILARLEIELNERGYLKAILPQGQADEQQLSGHNWLLRGLLEHYLWTGRSRSAELAKRLVENLFLPSLPLYQNYPTDPCERTMSGGADGCLDGHTIRGWHLSTDIGCAFMPLDGLAQYYAIFGDERVAQLMDAMIEAFTRIDFLHASMQTHASLSACRGIMRFYQCTGQPKLLDFVMRFFQFYIKNGMTENYANFNWFGRPLWTEPCGYIDSFILATALWQETRDPSYLKTANRIYQSAMAHGQRSNGGFGCDDCVGPGGASGLLRAQKKHYEAYWCCTMRGAEGLTQTALNAVVRDGNDFFITGPYSGRFDFMDVAVRVHASMVERYEIKADIAGGEGKKRMLFYLPDGVVKDTIAVYVRNKLVKGSWEQGMLAVEIVGNGEIRVQADMTIRFERPVSAVTRKDLFTCWLGDTMLGVNTQQTVRLNRGHISKLQRACFSDGEHVLEPAGQSILLEKEELLSRSMQVLFADQTAK